MNINIGSEPRMNANERELESKEIIRRGLDDSQESAQQDRIKSKSRLRGSFPRICVHSRFNVFQFGFRLCLGIDDG